MKRRWGGLRGVVTSEEGVRMAKALYGHMAAVDPRLLAEIGRLRARVKELENLVDRLEFERGMELAGMDLDTGLVPASV